MHSKNIKNKILVTGANGQLGRCMQDIAKEYPHYDFHFKSSSELDITKREAINSLKKNLNIVLIVRPTLQ